MTAQDKSLTYVLRQSNTIKGFLIIAVGVDYFTFFIFHDLTLKIFRGNINRHKVLPYNKLGSRAFIKVPDSSNSALIMLPFSPQ